MIYKSMLFPFSLKSFYITARIFLQISKIRECKSPPPPHAFNKSNKSDILREIFEKILRTMMEKNEKRILSCLTLQ